MAADGEDELNAVMRGSLAAGAPASHGSLRAACRRMGGGREGYHDIFSQYDVF